MKKRAVIISTVVIFGFFIVLLRMVDIMLVNHDRFLAKAQFQQVRKKAVPVKRGIIYDRKGRELAINLDTESIFCDPSEIASPEKAAAVLSKTMNVEPKAYLAKLTGDGRFNWLERKQSPDLGSRINSLKLRGIGTITEPKRSYPKGRLASQILGFVDIDNNGIEGIERQYNKMLVAQPEHVKVHRDARGNMLSDGTMKELKGSNIILTIDEGLQYILEKNLFEAMHLWKAASATGIIMSPETGEILAMSSMPDYDPNEPGSSRPEQRRNRSLTDIYEPGSTFKIIAGVAALEEKAVSPSSKFDCSAGSIEVGGKRIKDSHKNGVLSFREVIQKSSNVGIIKIALKLGKEKIYDYIKLFGFGEKTGIDMAGEIPGLLRPVNRWSGLSIGSISIGQEVGVTPLQVLRAYAVIANGGYIVTPYLISEIRTPDGGLLHKTVPQAERIVSENTADTFRDILKTVTQEGGTALEAAVDGNSVAGKTGTAQIIDPRTKRYSKDKYVSSFVGFVPADKPRLAMIVVIHEPKGKIYGGAVAGPVFKKTADEALSYMSVPRDDMHEKGLLLISTTDRR
ncbi:MAG: penicillin-binding protein 2 [Dissulfurispiraceae bacterium]|jgi:cell division protein FtsI (penicillin-binding protein 3)|nr:penicillin-binding protein 2 [Dissulfurispiraceae bacterium]